MASTASTIRVCWGPGSGRGRRPCSPGRMFRRFPHKTVRTRFVIPRDQGPKSRHRDGSTVVRAAVIEGTWTLVNAADPIDSLCNAARRTASAMGSSGEDAIDVEVRADRAVPAAATARAVELVRHLARASGRQIQYARVALGVDDQWRGRRSSQVEIVVDMVGIYVRGFAAGATFSEALEELDRKLEQRLGYARDRVRSRTGLRPAPLHSLVADPPAARSTGRSTAR